MRYKSANIASILGIFGNLFLLIIKILIGLFTKSQAMLSDALNSASDIISSIMTFIGNKIASKEADEKYNMGRGKAEYIFSLLISVIMIVLSLEILFTSFKSLIIKQDYNFSIYLIIVCIITIIVKFMLYIYTRNIALKYNNKLIEANSKDHINDCLLTSFNLIAAICGYFNITFIDSIIGGIISLFIIYVGSKLFKESFDILMDKGISPELKIKILEIIDKHDEIKKINHFTSIPIGYQYQISITIFVDGNLSTYESHEIANKLEKEISSLDEVYLTIIHVNPFEKK